jgi:class 3 adenylate cyclase
MDPSKPRPLLWGALLIAVFCGLTGVAGSSFVRWRVVSAVEQSLDDAAQQIEAALGAGRMVDLEAYNRSTRVAGDYAVVLSDGTVLDIGSGPKGLVHGVLPPVRPDIDYQRAFERPLPAVVSVAGTDEPWTFLARRLDRGIAILGISGLDPAVSDPARVLERNMARIGERIEPLRYFDGSAMDNGLHWAIIDARGELVAAHGRIPLATDPMALASQPLGARQLVLDGEPHVVLYAPLHDKSGRVIGRIILPRSFGAAARALRDELEFSLALAALSFAVFLVLLLRYSSRAEKDKRQLRDAFQRYLAPKIMNLVLSDPKRLALGGERREIAILFSDIRAFTEIAERLAPRQLTAMLQEYFEAMSNEVFREDGVLDKYIGDGVMAFWGAPIEQPDHADRAVRAAQAMIRRLADLQERWRRAGLPAFDIRIGINVGVATVGNVGSSRRFDYTAIGDTVNVASRLEELNKAHGSRIIISESVHNQLTIEVRVRDLGEVRLSGRRAAVRVFEVLTGDDPARPADPAEEAAYVPHPVPDFSER